MNYSWDFRFLIPYSTAFLRGTLVTIEISVLSFVFGTLLGALAGVWLRITMLRHVLLFLNDCVRAVPILVLLFLVYYFPAQQLFGIAPLDPFWSAVVAMGIAQAAYTADLVRGAIDGVSRRVILGGRALGLPEYVIWMEIILPDVMRQILPAEVAFFIGIVRLSSIASVIGCEEVVFVARLAVSQAFRSLEAWLVVAMIYIALVVPLTFLSRRLETWHWMKRRA
jgi:polar amino acid transport system permease protein